MYDRKLSHIILIEKIMCFFKELGLIIIPLYIQYFIDHPSLANIMMKSITGALFIIIYMVIMHLLYNIVKIRRINYFYQNTKDKIVNQVIENSLPIFNVYHQEGLTSILENDVPSYMNGAIESSVNRFGLYAKVIMSCVILFIINFQISLLYLAMMLLFSFLRKKIKLNLKNEIRIRQKEKENYSAIVSDLVNLKDFLNDKTIQNVSKYYHDPAHENSLNAYINFGKKKSLVMLVLNELINIEKILGLIILLVLSTYEFISIGSIVIYYAYMSDLYYVLSDIAEYSKTIEANNEISNKLSSIITHPSKNSLKNKIEKVEVKNGKFDFLNYSYNITLNAGESILIKGANGVGKSSLLKVLAQLKIFSSGNLFINNELVQSIDYYNDIEYMPQNDNQIMECYPLTNLAKTSKFEQLATKYKFTFNFDKIQTQSEGERQKLCIIYHLCQDRSFKIYDEPLSNLDSAAKLNYIKLITSENKMGINLVVSHGLDETMEAYFTKIIDLTT